MKRSIQSTITLNNGVKIPQLGFGTALISDDEGKTVDVILQAIEAGYTVTDKEVYDYLEELKQFINQSENKEDAMAIIEQFDSEEDYWTYDFEVYKKDLPIQKYMAAKEKEFKEVAPQAKSINEIEEDWQEYYEQIKAQVVENEEFKVVD